MTHVLIKRGNWNTNRYPGGTPCEDEGIYWGEASTGQGIPKIVSKSQKPGERSGTESTL